MAVGLPLKTTYANGDVYSASDVNDTNGTINLLQTSTLSVAGGKNRVVNGGMDWWQRGTSFASTSSATNYTADRWALIRGANPTAFTISRQATGDTTNLPFIQYAARIQRTAANTTTDTTFLATSLESVNSIPYAGKTVTISFYARAGSNYSAASSNLSYQLISGTGTDQNVYIGFTGAVAVVNTTATLTTTWQRFTATGTVATTATQLGAYFYYAPTGTAGTNDYFEITGVQLELGTTATTFSRAGGTIQGELAACQRYYELGWYQSQYSVQMQSQVQIFFKVTKRGTPTVNTDDSSGNAGKIGLKTAYLGGATLNSANFGLTEQRVDGFEEYDLANNYGKFFNWTASAEL